MSKSDDCWGTSRSLCRLTSAMKVSKKEEDKGYRTALINYSLGCPMRSTSTKCRGDNCYRVLGPLASNGLSFKLLYPFWTCSVPIHRHRKEIERDSTLEFLAWAAPGPELWSAAHARVGTSFGCEHRRLETAKYTQNRGQLQINRKC